MTTALTTTDPRDIQLGKLTLSATGISGDLGQPPTIEEFRSALAFVGRAAGASNWWIGDLANYADQWGDEYVQLLDDLGVEYETLRKYAMVAQQVPVGNRLPKISWTHHLAVSALAPADQRRWLRKAQPKEGGDKPRLSVAELKKELRAERLEADRKANPLPDGKYRVLYADPPWKYNDARTGTVESGAAEAQYSLLTVEEICELRDATGRTVADIVAPDSVLFLWATAPMLCEAMQVMSAWGFAYKAQFVWDKVRGYNGHYNDVRHELLLIGTQGSCVPTLEPLPDSVMSIEKTVHSQKPEEFRELIETMYPDGPYVELFARQERDGWQLWGNQAP